METFSEYFKKEALLSRIDARVKLLVSLSLLIMVLSYKGFTLSLIMTLSCLLISLWMKIPLRIFIFRFSEPVFIALIIIILKSFFSGSELIFSINFVGLNISAHKDGLMDGLMIGSRILGAVSIVAVMGFSTPFTEFIAALSWLRVPRGFIEVLMFAYRYIFVLLEDAMVIYNAQKNRLGYSNIRLGVRSFGILTGSLILKAFEHSNNIALSMIQRGYDGRMPLFRHKPLKMSEILASLLMLLFTVILWWRL